MWVKCVVRVLSPFLPGWWRYPSRARRTCCTMVDTLGIFWYRRGGEPWFSKARGSPHSGGAPDVGCGQSNIFQWQAKLLCRLQTLYANCPTRDAIAGAIGRIVLHRCSNAWNRHWHNKEWHRGTLALCGATGAAIRHVPRRVACGAWTRWPSLRRDHRRSICCPCRRAWTKALPWRSYRSIAFFVFAMRWPRWPTDAPSRGLRNLPKWCIQTTCSKFPTHCCESTEKMGTTLGQKQKIPAQNGQGWEVCTKTWKRALQSSRNPTTVGHRGGNRFHPCDVPIARDLECLRGPRHTSMHH